MNKKHPFYCFICWNSFIFTTHVRKILLLLDDCSAHGFYTSLPALRSIQVHFLVKNCTSKVQLVDSNDNAALKALN